MMVKCASGFQKCWLSHRRQCNFSLQRTLLKMISRMLHHQLLRLSHKMTIRCQSMHTVWTSLMVSKRHSMSVQKTSIYTNATSSLSPLWKEGLKLIMVQSLQFMYIQDSPKVRSMVTCLSYYSQVPWIGLLRYGVPIQDLLHSSALRVHKSMCMMHSGVPHIQVSSQVAMERA